MQSAMYAMLTPRLTAAVPRRVVAVHATGGGLPDAGLQPWQLSKLQQAARQGRRQVKVRTGP